MLFYSALPCPVLSCPVLPCLCCPVLSCPVLSCPILFCAALPALPLPFHCPVLSCTIALPCPTLRLVQDSRPRGRRAHSESEQARHPRKRRTFDRERILLAPSCSAGCTPSPVARREGEELKFVCEFLVGRAAPRRSGGPLIMPNLSFAPRRHGWPVLPALQLPFHCSVLPCPALSLPCYAIAVSSPSSSKRRQSAVAVILTFQPVIQFTDCLFASWNFPQSREQRERLPKHRAPLALLVYRPPHTPMSSQRLRGKASVTSTGFWFCGYLTEVGGIITGWMV